jgi:hypothetical protein
MYLSKITLILTNTLITLSQSIIFLSNYGIQNYINLDKLNIIFDK